MKQGYRLSALGAFDFRVRGPAPPEGADVWWRADDRRYANYDPWGDDPAKGSHLAVEMTAYVMLRATPKGVWLQDWLGGKHFVLGAATRQLAVPTKALALADLVARKTSHVRGCQHRLARAQEHLAAAQLLAQEALKSGTSGQQT